MSKHMGLPATAKAFLKESAPSLVACWLNKRTSPMPPELIASYCGTSQKDCSLYRYYLKDGKFADEFLQAWPWYPSPSLDPCSHTKFYLGLRVNDGTKFLWTREEIQWGAGTPRSCINFEGVDNGN